MGPMTEGEAEIETIKVDVNVMEVIGMCAIGRNLAERP